MLLWITPLHDVEFYNLLDDRMMQTISWNLSFETMVQAGNWDFSICIQKYFDHKRCWVGWILSLQAFVHYKDQDFMSYHAWLLSWNFYCSCWLFSTIPGNIWLKDHMVSYFSYIVLFVIFPTHIWPLPNDFYWIS